MKKVNVCCQTVDVLLVKIHNYKDYNTSRVTDVITFTLLWQPRCLFITILQIFKVFNTFPLILEKPCEICQADGNVCIDGVCCPRHVVHWAVSQKTFYFIVWPQNSIFFTFKNIFEIASHHVCNSGHKPNRIKKIICPSPLTTFHILFILFSQRSHGPEVEGRGLGLFQRDSVLAYLSSCLILKG